MKSVGKVGIAILASRILGLVRDQVFSFYFGATHLSDVFQMAFRIPNLLRDLFAEGALSAAFVTVFSRKKEKEGDEGAWKLARLTITLQYVVLGAIVILGIIFAPQIVRLIAPGFVSNPEKFALTVVMSRILFPFILFVGMAALVMGALNAYGRFGLPASASSFFNLGSIIVGVGLAWIFDPSFGETALICMAIGSLAGGFLQWMIQIPALRSFGYRFHPEWNLADPGLREIGKLMAPAMIGVSAVQINVMINSIFASYFPGSLQCLNNAFRLIQLPIGLFGVAISSVALPSLANMAAPEDSQIFREKVEKSLRLNAAFCIPAAWGLAILNIPIISLLFGYKKFDLYAVLTTADILRAYTIGLIGYASIKVLAPAFYALGRTTTPMLVSLGSIIGTVALNWFFVNRINLGPVGLALATSFTSLFSAGILLAILTRFIGNLSNQTWKAIGKILFSALIMGLLIWVLEWGLSHLFIPHRFWSNLTRVLLGTTLGACTYVLIARSLKLEEVREIEQLLMKKLFSRKDSSS